MNALNALAAGDFRALLDGILSDDRVEGRMPCPCGHLNTVIVVRSGRTVVMWTDAGTTHGSALPDEVMLTAYGSPDIARQEMDNFRASVEQMNGMAQLVAALGDETGVGIVVI